MGDAQDPDFGTRLAVGAIAGAVATLALLSTARRLQGPGNDRPPDALTLLLPFAYGAAAGALLAAADPRPGRLSGLIAGGGLWLAAETGLLPAMRIGPASSRPARHAVAMLAGHLAWGWSASEAIREVGALS